jgi:hypothetical protein
MASVALKVQPPARAEHRRAIAAQLIKLHVKYEGVFAQVEQLKDQLRDIAEADGAGFKEPFPDGVVEVSKGSEGGKFKGLMPVLDAAAFLALPEGRRDKLIDDKIVAMEKQFTKASRPSVSVKR